MNEPTPVPEKEPGVRRVGTITMGLVLVVSGVCMLISMFFPNLDLRWVLQAAPLALVSLGVETLLAAGRRSRIKYDWVGMLLCVLIVCTALGLYTMAWCFVHYPDHFFCF
ncbi:hypothetical protein KQI82_13765 [Oscillibacter sp. MSJ-2]|uniref:Uncharacterized protein n=1 Tax=Dysosmobacter acutus TaxID=2841504 RepID=A0ABS6FCH1_9FIRM|nr:hypothetical protein [Dysosmobacter acutus]MBU5627974.1 hypothetical protein [Dysosmobacter acutus]